MSLKVRSRGKHIESPLHQHQSEGNQLEGEQVSAPSLYTFWLRANEVTRTKMLVQLLSKRLASDYYVRECMLGTWHKLFRYSMALHDPFLVILVIYDWFARSFLQGES